MAIRKVRDITNALNKKGYLLQAMSKQLKLSRVLFDDL